VRLVGLLRVGTERQVPTTRQRCCPRRRDRVGLDGVAMMTEPEAPPRSKTVPRTACPAASPETRRRSQQPHQLGDREVATAQGKRGVHDPDEDGGDHEPVLAGEQLDPGVPPGQSCPPPVSRHRQPAGGRGRKPGCGSRLLRRAEEIVCALVRRQLRRGQWRGALLQELESGVAQAGQEAAG
jgi:hypothetical protein